MRRLAHLGAAGGLVAVLAGGEAGAQRPPHEAILSSSEYHSADVRALAEAHRTELEGLYQDVRRCVPRVDFNKPAISFRRPQDLPGALPYFALWVWVDTPEKGIDPGARATEAFRLHARNLIARLVSREPIQADPRVGGYLLVLTWVGSAPAGGGGRVIAESLIVRAEKPAAAAFVAGSLPESEFLDGLSFRLFDGETERPPPTRWLQQQRVVAPTPC